MPNLKDLRVRIASVKSTQKITAAMKMVAASKLKRAQEQAEAARPYAERMERMLGSLAASIGDTAGAPPLLTGTNDDQTHLLVVVTSDRGLCGGFNGQVVRGARARINQLRADGKDVKILCLGRKGRDGLRRDFEGAFGRCDAIVAPVAPSAAFKIGEKVNNPLQMYLGDLLTVPANLAGIPGISVPCGLTGEGLPIGLQILGPDFGEQAILKVAHAYEQTNG